MNFAYNIRFRAHVEPTVLSLEFRYNVVIDDRFEYTSLDKRYELSFSPPQSDGTIRVALYNRVENSRLGECFITTDNLTELGVMLRQADYLPAIVAHRQRMLTLLQED